MDDLKIIEYARDLDDKKRKLENELEDLEQEIIENQNGCEEHIIVIMNDICTFPHIGCKFRCALCRKHLSEITSTSLAIDTKHYLPNYDDRIKEQRDEKFDVIQTMLIGIMRQNPHLSKEELVCMFNNMIDNASTLEEDISVKDNGFTRKLEINIDNE